MNRGRGGSVVSTPNNRKPRENDRPRPNQKPTPPGKGTKNATARPRSRSPVKRSDKPEEPENEVEEVTTAEAPAEAAAEEAPKTLKHCGRPGEKKFNGRCRLFVANLLRDTSEDELKEMFSDFGDIGEVYVNKEKGFGFIRLDYRLNCEMAKLSMDKKLVKGRNIKVCYATHASAIELHGLDNYASNEFIENAMSAFGAVERCKVVCDDRGRSKGYAIVEFEWKKAAGKVLDRLKDEMFVLGRLPKPVFAKPFVLTDMEEGVQDETLQGLNGFEVERSHQPRFVNPNSFEYVWAKRWRDLFIEEQDRKAKLEQEMIDARCKLEFEMEAAIRQNDAQKIRDELERKQQELRMLSEDMMRRQEEDMRILERSRQRELAARSGNPEPPPTEEEIRNNEIQLSRENAARQADFYRLRERAQMAITQDGGMDMRGGYGGQRGGPPQQGFYGGGGGPHHQQGGMDFRNHQQRGPPMDMQRGGMNQRDMHQRGGPPRDIPPPRDVSVRDLASAGPPKDAPAAPAETAEPANST